MTGLISDGRAIQSFISQTHDAKAKIHKIRLIRWLNSNEMPYLKESKCMIRKLIKTHI